MLSLAYDTGRPEDADSPGVRKFSDASIILLEECSRARRTLDDQNLGYWSLVGKDEQEARTWGRHRMSIFYRQGWDEIAVSGISWAALWAPRSIFKYYLTGLPGSGPWLAFEKIRQKEVDCSIAA